MAANKLRRCTSVVSVVLIENEPSEHSVIQSAEALLNFKWVAGHEG